MSDDDDTLDAASAAQMLRLRGLIEDGKVVIFNEREAKTLLQLAIYFDVEHDDSNLVTLKKVIATCQSLLMLGVSVRLMAVVIAAALGAFAALAQLAEKIPFIDRVLHWGSPK